MLDKLLEVCGSDGQTALLAAASMGNKTLLLELASRGARSTRVTLQRWH
jgi:hypothetical protein